MPDKIYTPEPILGKSSHPMLSNQVSGEMTPSTTPQYSQQPATNTARKLIAVFGLMGIIAFSGGVLWQLADSQNSLKKSDAGYIGPTKEERTIIAESGKVANMFIDDLISGDYSSAYTALSEEQKQIDSVDSLKQAVTQYRITPDCKQRSGRISGEDDRVSLVRTLTCDDHELSVKLDLVKTNETYVITSYIITELENGL